MKLGEIIFIIFCSIGAINALFLSIYIWFHRSKNTIPNLLLFSFLIIIAFRIIRFLLVNFQNAFDLSLNLPIIFYAISASSLVGPLFYLYLRSISIKNYSLKVTDILHAIPFIVISTFQFYFAYNSSYTYSIYITKHTVVLCQFIIYIVVSVQHIKRIQITRLQEENLKELNFNALKNIVIMFSLLWILDVINFIFILTNVKIYSFLNLNIFYTYSPETVFYSILIYFLLFIELKSGKITNLNWYTSKYNKSALPVSEALKLKEKIICTVNEDKVYKDHNITLGLFAKQINITPHILSQVINEYFKCNFNDFINSYRIEEAKKMLTDIKNSNYTIASIAYECGFNTLSAFNNAFKKFTGLTPTQYKSIK